MSVRRRKIAERLERDLVLQEKLRTVPIGIGPDARISRMGRYLTWRVLRGRT